MKYKILECWASILPNATEALASMVASAILNDWKPLGGVSIIATPDGFYAAQAVVKG